MTVVYVCAPYSGDVERNVERIRRWCHLNRKLCVPVAPQLFLDRYISEEEERLVAMMHSIVLMGRCDAVVVLGRKITEGMGMELELAKVFKIPILRRGWRERLGRRKS